MLNVLWAAMILLGIAYGAATGRFPEVSEAALSSAKEAVTLAITMLESWDCGRASWRLRQTPEFWNA